VTGPPKKERRLYGTAIQKLQLQPRYHALNALQAFFCFWQRELIRSRAPIRRCVVCGVQITNRNLGGYSGRSALSGPLWCLSCADNPQQRCLSFKEEGRDDARR
jgi:hypothetical protein